IGAITSTGRLIRFSPVDLPVVPAGSIQLAAGVKITDYLALTSRAERVLALVSLSSPQPTALGTRQGAVKRVAAAHLPNRSDFEVISLKPGDEVVGARQADDTAELVFITSDARLLRFTAAQVRPQGRSAGGMAGIKLGNSASVIHFAALDSVDGAVVATVS